MLGHPPVIPSREHMNSPADLVVFARSILAGMDTALTLDEVKAELSRSLAQRKRIDEAAERYRRAMLTEVQYPTRA